MGTLQQVSLQQVLGDLGTVAENVDAVGRRRDAFGQHPLPEQGVDETRFSGVELSGDHQQEQPVQLFSCLLKTAQVLRGDIRSEPLEGGRQTLQELLLADANFLLALGEDSPTGQQLPDHDHLPISAIRSGLPLHRYQATLLPASGPTRAADSRLSSEGPALAGPFFLCCRFTI